MGPILGLGMLAIEQMSKNIHNPRFSREINSTFSKTLRSKVNAYFKTNAISRNANANMVTKTIVMLSFFFVPIILLSSGLITSVWALFTAYLVAGFGMSGIGMGIMHDAIHGSYSRNKNVNTILGYTFNLIGANDAVWKVQHNVLHHSFTNIEHADDDINAPFFLRFSPHAKHYWLHRFQHIYIWFFYGISTISWITTKDFVRLTRYKNMGFFNKKHEFKKVLSCMIGWKLLYYTYALALPMIIVPQAWWLILLAFLSMHFVTGLLVSTVFQVAHIMPENEFPLPDKEGDMSDDWYSHQFNTTTNFSPKSKFLSWMIGGLNYQVEHHVLPDVCHIHYKKLTKIVAETAEEYGMEYHVKKNFGLAIMAHIKMLRLLGKKQTVIGQ